jgi:hypothetical protein
MKRFFGLTTAALLLAACADRPTGDKPEATAEKTGGSMEGAGGAGPGYDGSGSGRGKHGTVPESGAAARGQTGNSQTNTSLPDPSKAPPAQTSAQ